MLAQEPLAGRAPIPPPRCPRHWRVGQRVRATADALTAAACCVDGQSFPSGLRSCLCLPRFRASRCLRNCPQENQCPLAVSQGARVGGLTDRSSVACGKKSTAAPPHGLGSLLNPRGGFARLLSPGERPCSRVGESMPFQRGAGFSRLPALGLGLPTPSPTPSPEAHVASRDRGSLCQAAFVTHILALDGNVGRKLLCSVHTSHLANRIRQKETRGSLKSGGAGGC